AISRSTCFRRSPATNAPRQSGSSSARVKHSRSRSAMVSDARWTRSMASRAASHATARLGGILALAERSDRFRDLASRLEERASLAIADASAGARAFAWSALVDGGRPLAVVAPSEDRARRWRAELAGWLGDDRVLSFPERETMPFEVGTPT